MDEVEVKLVLWTTAGLLPPIAGFHGLGVYVTASSTFHVVFLTPQRTRHLWPWLHKQEAEMCISDKRVRFFPVLSLAFDRTNPWI